MQFLLSVFIVSTLAVMLADCRTLPASQSGVARNSTPCSIELASTCSTIQDSDHHYSLQLDTEHFQSSGEIKVKVHATQCECALSDIPLVWWFQVEVVDRLGGMSGSGEGNSTESSPGGENRAGTFRVAMRKQEMSLCEEDSRAVFSSCSPGPLDLPRYLAFSPNSKYAKDDTLCFRLTLQQSGEGSCLRKEVCLQLPSTPKQTPPTKYDVAYDSGKGRFIISEIENIHLPSSGVGVGSGQGQVDGAEGLDQEGDDDDEIVREIIRTHTGSGGSKVDVPAQRGCYKARDFFLKHSLPWIPDCNCEGYYKSVQCLELDSELQCWCSTPSGSEIHSSRKTIDCTDPQSLEFHC